MFSTSSTWITHFGDRFYTNISLVQLDPFLPLTFIPLACFSALSHLLVIPPSWCFKGHIALWAALTIPHLYLLPWFLWMFVLHLLQKNVYVKNKYQKRSIWPSLLIYLIFFLMAYVNLALVPCWLWRKLTSLPFIPKPIFALAMLMTWRKPFRTYVGKLSKCAFGEEITKCGFKLPHTILLAFHMVNSARWTMTWHGRKSSTPTRFPILHVDFTFGLTTLKAHGKLSSLWGSSLSIASRLLPLLFALLWEHVLCGFWLSVIFYRRAWIAHNDFTNLRYTNVKKEMPWTPSPPGWVCVCVPSQKK